jgi:hypothetical protein
VGGGSLVPNNVTYSYDRLYRLLGDGTRSYAYDPIGSRTSPTEGATTAYTYDRADRVLTAGAVSYTVDANRNLVARGGEAFTYDQPNRLTSATISGIVATCSYHGRSSARRRAQVVSRPRWRSRARVRPRPVRATPSFSAPAQVTRSRRSDPGGASAWSMGPGEGHPMR